MMHVEGGKALQMRQGEERVRLPCPVVQSQMDTFQMGPLTQRAHESSMRTKGIALAFAPDRETVHVRAGRRQNLGVLEAASL